jgi:hypothetical protein
VLELDHVFCLVTDPGRAAIRLEDDGWVLDAGQAHPGQGTRNRRLAWPGLFFELLWVTARAEARANPLRLDRRADWATTGASPVGLAFRGRLDPPERGEFWLYDALGFAILIHHDNERAPERPLVLVLETDDQGMERRRRRSTATTHSRPGTLREIRVHSPSPPSLPPYAGPPITHVPGPHRLELVTAPNGSPRQITDALIIRR